MFRLPKIGLLPRIAFAIAIGIACGYFMPLWTARACETFTAVFGQYLGFLIPLIIIGFVAPAIGDLGEKAGKLLLATAALAYVATMLSGLAAYFTADSLFPSMVSRVGSLQTVEDTSAPTPFFNVDIPPLMPVMTALVFAFLLGLGIAFVNGSALRNGIREFRDIVAKTIAKSVIPLLPPYIFSIFASMTFVGQIGMIISTFIKIIAVIFALHIAVLVFQYCVAALFSRRNPFKMLWTMMPAYFTALGTQSSAATIPVTLRQTVKMGVSEDIAGFVIPLCATIHMSGSTLKIVSCAIAIMLMQAIPYDFSMMINFIALLGVTIIAAPGIPGGAIMASLGLLTSILGFNDQQNALMIAIYIAMDNFGTACNVTGDGALATIIDRFFGKKTVPAQ